jgi:hypothetical protein
MPSSPVISRRRGSREKSDTLVAALFTLLGVAVITIAVLASTVQKRDDTISSLKEKIAGMAAGHPLSYYQNRGGNLPMSTAVRRSASGTGFVLVLTNESTEELPLNLGLMKSSGQKKTAQVTLDPRQTTEFSHFNDWKLADGDSLELSHEGFNSVMMRVH